MLLPAGPELSSGALFAVTVLQENTAGIIRMA